MVPWSVQFSRSVVYDSLRPPESQHPRPPCQPQTPGVYSNSCLSDQWGHPSISSSVIPFSSCPQPIPASGSFPMSQLFASGGQSSFSSSTSPSNEHSGLISFRMDWLQSKGLSRVFSNTTRVLKWFSIPFSSGPWFVRTLQHDPLRTMDTISPSSDFIRYDSL